MLLGVSLVYRDGGFTVLRSFAAAMQGKSDLVYILALVLALIFAAKDFTIHRKKSAADE